MKGASGKPDRATHEPSQQAVSAVPVGIPSAEVFVAMGHCPDYPDFPTAWAIQRSHGDQLQHHEHCSSVPGWDPISGPAFLCDCGAIRDEWHRIRKTPEAAQAIEARRAETGTGSVHESSVGEADAPQGHQP